MTTVERKGKLNIQISLDPFLLFVLTSVLIHGLGLLILVLSNRALPAARQETESIPIDFVIVPPEESLEKPPPETERRAVNNSVAKGKVEPELPSATDKIANEEAIATSEPSQATQPNRQEAPSIPVVPQTPPPPRVKPNPRSKPKPVTPPPSLTKVPKPASAPSTPTPPPSREKPNPPILSKPKPGLPPVATNLPPKPKPIEPSSPPTEPPSTNTNENSSVPETTLTPSSERKTPVSSGSASLLGGTYSRSLSEDSGSSFFNPQANASQQALNPSGVDARQDLDLGPYLAEIRRRVKRNWRPSTPINNRNTVLAFSIQRNGQITGLRVIRSSGSPKVDRESLEAVKKSSPFAALPQNFPNEQLSIEFNFNIYVNQGVFTPKIQPSW